MRNPQGSPSIRALVETWARRVRSIQALIASGDTESEKVPVFRGYTQATMECMQELAAALLASPEPSVADARPTEHARRFMRGEISAGKFGELLGLGPGELHDFKMTCGAFEDARPGWQPIESAPQMRTILLFAVTDRADDGTVRNWKMATGSWHTGYEDDRSRAEGYTPWTWAGIQLKAHDVQPTHWMKLPEPPEAK